ncbi:hypothetical protein AVEN_147905-1 [Araneus ventricosus]|uniref:Uncharacterized protein n=1 Tax=Araneus ventricosus TaxID=182803 RepID=A0A4Y2DX06_ARAVE|nr:hypothetical protein AVEN_147905-1 [Araneus ventricosus]
MPSSLFVKEESEGSKANVSFSSAVGISSLNRDGSRSAFTPYKPTTVLTNLQRGNVQTQTPAVLPERSIHQLAAQGELFLQNIGEARRVFQQKNAKYAESVKTLPAVSNIEESLNAKFENLLKTINDRFERQMQLFADMLQKSMNCILQIFFKIFEQSVDPSLSPARKKKLLSKFNQISSTLSTWDAGGPSEVEQMSLN